MRHAGRAKAGFYPTPDRVVEMLLPLLQAPAPRSTGGWSHYSGGIPADLALLDPTCGDGRPLAILAEHLRRRPANVSTYGIELDRKRAAKARNRLSRVSVGDARRFKAAGFSLLFLNPPYDDAGGGQRLEVEFLKQYTEALMPGGVLVYVIPESSLAAAGPWLLSHFDRVRAHRFPEPEYQAFRQVVVLGEKRREAIPPNTDKIPVEGDLEEHLRLFTRADTFYLPQNLAPPRLEDHGLEPDAYIELARESEAWHALAAHAQHSEAPVALPPLLPMSAEHLALLVAAGHLNYTVINTEDGPLLLRGEVKKVVVELPVEDDEDRTIRREQERYVSAIQVLNLKTLELTEVQ